MLSKRDRGCHMLVAYAPEGTTMREANDAINAFVAEPSRGFLLFHDHFADTPGGVGVFDVSTQGELDALHDHGPLTGWDVCIHPLIFAGGRKEFLFQMDYTMMAYRDGSRLRDLHRGYEQSELCGRNDAR